MNYNVTVNGKVYSVTVEKTGAAPAAAPVAAAPVAAAAPAAAARNIFFNIFNLRQKKLDFSLL